MTTEYALIGSGIVRTDSLRKEGMIDFGDGRGRVPAYRRRNSDDTMSGWIAETAGVSWLAYVGFKARVPCGVVIWSDARLEKPDDLRVGSNWSAHRTDHGSLRLVSKVPGSLDYRVVAFSSWDELPRVLHTHGYISTMEYLASVAGP